MQQPSEPLENLIDQFSRFPGVGRKGATRMAYEVMSMPNEQAMELAKASAACARTILRRRSARSVLLPNGIVLSSVLSKPRGISRLLNVPMNTKAFTMYCTG